MSIYQKRIDIVVQSKLPEVLKEFKEGFSKTTQKFKNLTLHELTGENYGAVEINKVLRQVIKTGDFFGVFNDDVWFADGWLEDCLKKLQTNACVSAGYIETDDREQFKRAVEKTKNEKGTIDYLYGAGYIFHSRVFQQIGIFDERYEWSCDDLDWMWRLKLNGMRSATSKKVTTTHIGFITLREGKARRHSGKRNKIRFAEKHGHISYKIAKELYQPHRDYFNPLKLL